MSTIRCILITFLLIFGGTLPGESALPESYLQGNYQIEIYPAVKGDAPLGKLIAKYEGNFRQVLREDSFALEYSSKSVKEVLTSPDYTTMFHKFDYWLKSGDGFYVGMAGIDEQLSANTLACSPALRLYSFHSMLQNPELHGMSIGDRDQTHIEMQWPSTGSTDASLHAELDAHQRIISLTHYAIFRGSSTPNILSEYQFSYTLPGDQIPSASRYVQYAWKSEEPAIVVTTTVTKRELSPPSDRESELLAATASMTRVTPGVVPPAAIKGAFKQLSETNTNANPAPDDPRGVPDPPAPSRSGGSAQGLLPVFLVLGGAVGLLGAFLALRR